MSPSDFIALVGLVPDSYHYTTEAACFYKTRREDIAQRVVRLAVAAHLRVTHVIHPGYHTVAVEGFE